MKANFNIQMVNIKLTFKQEGLEQLRLGQLMFACVEDIFRFSKLKSELEIPSCFLPLIPYQSHSFYILEIIGEGRNQ